MRKLDLVGQRFGRLLVIASTDEHRRRARLWLCKCDCGNQHKVTTDNLRGKHIESCGCLLKESASRNGIKNRMEYGKASLNALYGKYRYQAVKRGYCFDLSVKEFGVLTESNCVYCGSSPELESRATRRCFGTYTYNGVDRVDNSNGYTIDNVVTCCKRCNLAKNNMGLDEFKSWVRRAYECQNKT
jgi:5-methylcytosine-specific restriction endonuclease McrA